MAPWPQALLQYSIGVALASIVKAHLKKARVWPRAVSQSICYVNRSRHQRPASIGKRLLIAVDVPAVLAVVRCGQEREVLGDTVRRDIDPNSARRTDQEVNAIAGLVDDVIRPAHHADRDVSHVVIRTPAVRPPGGVCAQ